MDRESWVLSLRALKPKVGEFAVSLFFLMVMGGCWELGVSYRAWIMIIVKVR